MSILSRLVSVIGLKSAFTQEAYSGRTSEAAPPALCSGDGLLRRLAEEHHAGKTDWVMASDMASLLEDLDTYNEGRAAEDTIRVRVSKGFDALSALLDMGCHLRRVDEDENPIANTGAGAVEPGFLWVQQADRFSPASYDTDRKGLLVETHTGWQALDLKGEAPLRNAVFVEQPLRTAAPRHDFGI